jgi:hypothetical protein
LFWVLRTAVLLPLPYFLRELFFAALRAGDLRAADFLVADFFDAALRAVPLRAADLRAGALRVAFLAALLTAFVAFLAALVAFLAVFYFPPFLRVSAAVRAATRRGAPATAELTASEADLATLATFFRAGAVAFATFLAVLATVSTAPDAALLTASAAFDSVPVMPFPLLLIGPLLVRRWDKWKTSGVARSLYAENSDC